MRTLTTAEIANVAGAGSSCYTPPVCIPTPPCAPKPPVCAPTPPACEPKKAKGNNGFGNGGHDGVPGKSGKTDCNR